MIRGLGRRHAPDIRDASYPASALLTTVPTLTYRYWNASGWWGDQGSTPRCVGYAWAHWLEDGPVTHKGPSPIVGPSAIYTEAQKVDEWPGEDYDGTSVRAGAKVLQSKGFIKSYHWAITLTEIVATLLTIGPMVVGMNWYESMFEPDEAGLLHVGGSVAGGHAFKLDGINLRHSLVRVKNSWGRDWGNNGFAYLHFGDLERLLAEDGEACVATEIRP